jgi:hypothetical protein
VLDDIELTALSIAVRNGLDDLHGQGPELLAVRRRSAREAIESGRVIQLARNLQARFVGTDLAALAMLPGGVRIDEIVFCARHYPGGYDARFRLSCPDCSPDDHKPGESRDVVAIEGIF